jgi:phospholipid/cholesterol/gamma-HCH transport system substrate-binding protein
MSARSLVAAVIGVVVVVGAYLLLSSGPSPYEVKIRLADADGLRQGSPVAIAGQDVGTISLGVQNDHVVVTMKVDRKYGPIGRNATASIASVNLLGQKRIQLTKGSSSEPAPNNYVLPASRVSVSPDLDQVLDVLTPDVRARLSILINEAGQMVTGREADLSQVFEQLPPDLVTGQKLLSAIADNNHTLGDLVQTSDGFVTELANQHTALVHAINVVGQTASTLTSRRQQLSATLANAPGTLNVLDGFLKKLQATTVPLGPAAKDISATAPELQDTLKQVEPFRAAADPVLTQATSDAPELTKLAIGATPTLQRATPVVQSLATFSDALQPISDTLDKSVDNLLATLENWARAIQFRDGLSHVFRGEAAVSPETALNLVSELIKNPVSGTSLAKLETQLRSVVSSSSSTKSTGSGLSGLLNALGGAAKHSTGSSSSTKPAAGSTTTTATTSSSSTTTQTTTTTTSSSGSKTPLSSLLSFLLKP